MMNPKLNKVIFAEYNDKERFSLSAETDRQGLNLTLKLRDVSLEGETVNKITMTDSEFNRLAESLGYKRQTFNNMEEIYTDSEFHLIENK